MTDTHHTPYRPHRPLCVEKRPQSPSPAPLLLCQVSRKEYLRGGGGGSTVLDSSFLDSPETNPPPGSSVHFAFALEGELSPSAEKPMPLSRQVRRRVCLMSVCDGFLR